MDWSLNFLVMSSIYKDRKREETYFRFTTRLDWNTKCVENVISRIERKDFLVSQVAKSNVKNA